MVLVGILEYSTKCVFFVSSFAAHLHSGELVAVKVQRPGMSHLLTLDALLFNMIGGQLKRFAKARKDLFVAVNEVVSLLVGIFKYQYILCTTFEIGA